MSTNANFKIKIILFLLVVFSFVAYFGYHSLFFSSHPKEEIVYFPENTSVKNIALSLEEKGIIKSNKLFLFLINRSSQSKKIESGDYFFKTNISIFTVVYKLSFGVHGIDPIKVTLREGLTNQQMSEILDSKIPLFDKESFLLSEKNNQGYLFPDTYFFYRGVTNKDVLEVLNNNFKNKIDSLDIDERKLSDLIIMASIIEKEANGKNDASVISGILWKRLSIGMPLQVDVALETYKNKGLPQSPINNPGLSSIKAALLPVSSPYLYYLHDKNGMVHYAKDFDEHKKNIRLYLK